MSTRTHQMSAPTIRVVLLVVLSFSLLLFFPALSCNQPLIRDVTFNADPNLETAKVALEFSNDVQTDLGGSFDIANNGVDYGNLEVDPSTPNSPFSVGFRLNMSILNDQDYARLDPVTTLPNGQPLPMVVNRAMAQVKAAKTLNPNFDIYAYLDIVGKEWIGLAVTLKFLDNKNFPAGLTISKDFLPDANKNPRAAGAFFGPKVDPNGQMQVPGGIALFANVKALLSGAELKGQDKGSKYVFGGFAAPYYQTHPKAAWNLEQAFRSMLKANSYGHSTLR